MIKHALDWLVQNWLFVVIAVGALMMIYGFFAKPAQPSSAEQLNDKDIPPAC